MLWVKDIFNPDLAIIILALVVPITWVEDRRRRQILQVIREIHASGQIIPAEVWERLLNRGGTGDRAGLWTLPIALVSAAAGLMFAALPVPLAVREGKLFLAVAITCLIASAGTALVARSRSRDGE
ncbi:MAG TPA: hypothetical protein VF727_04880 [Allosphingosinicella sp.]|jgi:hypothetical protein